MTSLPWIDENSTETIVPTLLPRITHSSTLELYITLIIQTASALWVFVAHSLIIYTVWRSPVLHTPNNYIMATYAVLDIIMHLVSLPLFLATMPTNTPLPDIACQLGVMNRIAAFFAMVYILAVMAYERYRYCVWGVFHHQKIASLTKVGPDPNIASSASAKLGLKHSSSHSRYFVHPLTHPVLFSPRRTAVIIGLALGVPWVYACITEITLGRVYHESAISCQLQGTRYLNYLQICAVFVPSLVVTSYCTLRIWRLAMASRVAPAEMGRDVDAAAATTASSASKISVTLKSIMLVSGAFWGSYIPGYVIRTVLFSSGYTWYDMDTRREYGASIAVRISQMILMDVSSVLNPFIYYYTNKQLRARIRNILGKPTTPEGIAHSTNAST